jgi:two-component system sensor kinase FixL
MALVISGLWVSAQWPAGAQQMLLLGAWAALLLLTVYLTSRITRDLRRRDATIREQHQRMDAIVQTAVDGIITIDERGIIHSANAASERLFKYPPGGLLGRNVNVLMPREIALEHDQYLRNYLTTRQAKIIGIGREVIGQASDGQTFPLDLSVSEVPLEGRTLFTGIVRNISERKRNEDQLRCLSAELQRHQQSMIQNEKMTAMGQMAAGIVHEISNPLASMDSVLQLVSRHPERLNDGAMRTLGEQLLRVHRIVRQLTEFAHPNDTLWETRDLNELVVAAMEMVRFDRRSHCVQVEYELEPAAGSVRVMPPAMQQVLVNMTLNAFDALSGVAAPRLVVATAVRNGWKVIEMRDNGQGIAPEHLPHLFEPFFTTKPLGHGTGLGLSISYSLIKRHGGECEVTSRLGQGTTFRILLPSPASADAGVTAEAGNSCA